MLVTFVLTSCRYDGDCGSDSVDHIGILRVLVKADLLCLKADSVYIYQTIRHRRESEKLMEVTFDTSAILQFGGITGSIVSRGFLDYPRQYPCVHSLFTNEIAGDTIEVTIRDFNDLQDPYFGGKAEAEQYMRKFIMTQNSDCSYRILAELDVWN